MKIKFFNFLSKIATAGKFNHKFLTLSDHENIICFCCALFIDILSLYITHY